MNLKAYWLLTKPRLASLCLVNFLVAMKLEQAQMRLINGVITPISWHTALLGLVGVFTAIGSGNVWNMLQEISLDSVMERTKCRPLVTGLVQKKQAFMFGILLCIISIFIFTYLHFLLGVLYVVVGLVFYNLLYTAQKRRTPWHLVWGILPGSLSVLWGSVPHTPHSWLLGFFLWMCVWQVPHFLAIAMYNKDQYYKGGVKTIAFIYGDTKIKPYMFASSIFGILWGVYALHTIGASMPVWVAFILSAPLFLYVVLAYIKNKTPKQFFFFTLLWQVYFMVLIVGILIYLGTIA
jgi:heme o synthase